MEEKKILEYICCARLPSLPCYVMATAGIITINQKWKEREGATGEVSKPIKK